VVKDPKLMQVQERTLPLEWKKKRRHSVVMTKVVGPDPTPSVQAVIDAMLMTYFGSVEERRW
jgi:hypothetical protein